MSSGWVWALDWQSNYSTSTRRRDMLLFISARQRMSLLESIAVCWSRYVINYNHYHSFTHSLIHSLWTLKTWSMLPLWDGCPRLLLISNIVSWHCCPSSLPSSLHVLLCVFSSVVWSWIVLWKSPSRFCEWWCIFILKQKEEWYELIWLKVNCIIV